MPAKKAVSEKAKDSFTTKIKLKTPPVVFNKTQEQIQKLSKLLGCPVMVYFKPPTGNIWEQDLYAILEGLKKVGKTDVLALYIRSNGGNGIVSLRMINLLRSFAKKLILLAPFECASAATMLALGCDEIYMGPLSSLSPVDSSLTHQLAPVDKFNNSVPVSLDELWRVLRLWKEAQTNQDIKKQDHIENELNFVQKKVDTTGSNKTSETNSENPYKYLYDYIHPLVFGAVDRYSSLSVRICKEILGYHVTDQEKIDSIARHLNYNYPAHGYPITMKEAQKIGLPVTEISPKMLDVLNNLQLLYSELTEDKITDYDNSMYHDNSIYSVVEATNIQITYLQNYDKFYREAEKRYITLNDLSGWFKTAWKAESKDKAKSNITSQRIFL